MSFNRPQFLEETLGSLKNQAEHIIDGHEIHLFQDGAVNRYSRIRYAKDDDIVACINLFKKYFPNGIIHRSPENIGVCENFRRAENFVFKDLSAECAYFFEDDLVLSPHYIAMLNKILDWAASMPNVAYFSAYGNYFASQDEVAERHRHLMTLDHHWAFGLLRRHWEAMQPILQPFYDIVVGNDYSRRHHRDIFALYQQQEVAPRASSQDAAKALACDRLGLWRCNTVQPFARYIGTSGQHMTPEAFERLGFARAVIATQPEHNLLLPTPAWISGHLKEQHNLFKQIRRDEMDRIVAQFPPRQYSPMRKCTHDEVIFGYRLFLNRDPESESIIAGRVNRQTVYELVKELVHSDEYRNYAGGRTSRLCEEDDVTYAYRLCLHRDPESRQIYDEHVAKTEAFVLARAIWNDEARVSLWKQIEPLPSS
jgi:hypothetical protein